MSGCNWGVSAVSVAQTVATLGVYAARVLNCNSRTVTTVVEKDRWRTGEGETAAIRDVHILSHTQIPLRHPF